MATIYGEQDEEKVNWELHEKNRKAWNTWAIKNGAPRESKQKVCEFLQIAFDEHFHGNSDQNISEITTRFRQRMKHRSEYANRQLPTTNEIKDFSGILCANHLVLKGLYSPNDLQIDGAKFGQSVHFNQSYYASAVEFKECEFLEHFDCSNSKVCMGASNEFQDALTILNSNFHKRTDFSSCLFYGSANLQGNEFNMSLSLGKSTIAFELEVSDTAFSSFDLRDAKIEGETEFSNLEIGGKANFVSTVFGGDFKASTTIFTSEAIFTEVAFTHYCGFIGCNFEEGVDFEKVLFHGFFP